ncbi:lymphatic vessel endothelial hyaluronic acid receptor 1a [Ictalurus punctatus]|uniref:Lymphatic vessel endothelial hyaluronic acid receptor 1 n=1 Tax=Ictalurus punctatus TaxID=7998 RepID=W5UMV0_ICTPU|nr:lymphatic vessel endothelial hyaluronic acid receptor 1a [Ictalurus punctatus]
MAAKSRMLLLLLAHLVSSALLIDVTQIIVNPKHGSVVGVFQASLSGDYAFNASVARDVCEQLGVGMANKAQLNKALALGFETCRFGWTDEQVAVIPRILPKDTCGKGRVGLITWRTLPSYKFDVYCFNSTDYEAHMNTEHEYPSTAVIPTARTSGARTSGAHPKLAKPTRSASRDDPQSTSSSLPHYTPEKDTPESQAFSNTSPNTAVGLIALLTTLFAFLLLAVAAVCYFKKNRVGRWKKSQEKETIETEVCGKTRKESESEVQNDVSVTIKLENEKIS